MKIVLLRPQPGAKASAKRARLAGFDPIIAPLFVIEPVAWQMPDQLFDALLVTSANAIRHIGPLASSLVDLPVLAVGAASADAAAKAGFTVKMVGDSDAATLLIKAKAAGYRAFLWLTGADHKPMDRKLAGDVTMQIVYHARAIEPMADLATHLGPDALVALHSPRAAQSFAGYCDRAGIDKACLNIAAFSPAIADAAGSGWRAIVVAAAPNDASLFLAVQSLFIPHPNDPDP